MGHKKLIRFEAIKQFKNVLQFPENVAGTWHSFFENSNSITLELACGKGEYTFSLAQKYPDRNVIGVDLKGNRIYAGAKKSIEAGVKNAAFLRTQIERINEYFTKDEVSEIWITFPDPQLRLSKAKKRLTHPRFLRLYQQILKNEGVIHLKTDSPDLYAFTLKVISLFNLTIIKASDNVYAEQDVSDDLKIKTYYESLDIAKSSRVHYIQFKVDKELPAAKDIILKQMLAESETAVD